MSVGLPCRRVWNRIGFWRFATVLIVGLSSASIIPARVLAQETPAEAPAAADETMALAATVASEEEAAAFFETKIRPLLVARCYECHSAESGELGGGLALDTREGWAAGGDLGPAIVPSEPDKSWLIRAVRPTDDALQMPPDTALSATEIADLERWVSSGAFDPRSSGEVASGGAAPRPVDIEEGRQFWAFVPVSQEAAAAVSEMGSAAVSSERWRAEDRIDWAIENRWRAFGIEPVPAAGRRELLRRITLDLTGLPPTYEELSAFEAETRPDALDRQIDRLLASSAYGERWGRHWLDVARYADSNGSDENIAHGNAWRYRDWVIEAFGADLPYDQFVAMQIAGDLLPPTDDESERIARTIATGFLSLGPKVIAEVDETKMEMDIIDEQVDTIGRSLMGMTLGCARCHDHKFDPIRIDDYYAFAGVFKSTRTMEHFTKIAKWWEVPIETETQRIEREARVAAEAEIKAEIDKVVAEADAALAATLDGMPLPEDKETRYDEATRNRLTELRAEWERRKAAIPVQPTAMGVQDYEKPTDLPIHIRGNHLTLGDVVPRGLPLVMTSVNTTTTAMPGDSSGRLQLVEWLTDREHPLFDRVWVNRVWKQHFGRGIVASTDNFGVLGERPSHPELLDDLVLRFREAGRSTKWLHRTLLTSATYRRDVYEHAANANLDPEGATFWRFDLRRLEAEAVRDAMLLVSGLLDYKRGGSLLHVGNREFLFDHTSTDLTKYDARVRSVYLPVIRNHLYDLFALFDYNDASVPVGARDATVVPSQALFLMNAPLVDEAATALAEASRVEASGAVSEGDAQAVRPRIEWLFRQALARDPSDAELQRVAALVTSPEGAQVSERRWALVAQTLLISNEFLHVR